MQNIFSTGIETFKLDGIDNESIINYSEKNSIRNGVKENIDILTNDIFTELNNVVKIKMNEYYSKIYNDKYNMIISQAWSNVNNDDLITIPHNHKESFISAVYYPLATDGYISFLNPMQSLISHQSNNMIDEFNEYNSDYYKFNARTGHLIVFNSMLQHYIGDTKEKRISIAYNGNLKNAR